VTLGGGEKGSRIQLNKLVYRAPIRKGSSSSWEKGERKTVVFFLPTGPMHAAQNSGNPASLGGLSKGSSTRVPLESIRVGGITRPVQKVVPTAITTQEEGIRGKKKTERTCGVHGSSERLDRTPESPLAGLLYVGGHENKEKDGFPVEGAMRQIRESEDRQQG